MVAADLDVADGRGSSGPKQPRRCLEKEISTSAILRGRRKTPRWLFLDAVKNFLWCSQSHRARQESATKQKRRLEQRHYTP